MAQRTTQAPAEVVIGATSELARITQAVAEPVIFTTNELARVTQVLAEVVFSATVTPPVIPTPTVKSSTFDAGIGGEGNGGEWFLCAQLTDSSIEDRDKVVKSFRVTGKLTSGQYAIYGYAPSENIDVAAIEAGTGSRTGQKTLPNSARVVQSARQQLNVSNAMLHTVRLSGIWTEDGSIKDRIDEICVEVAQQGIRR